jgi:hypothetical protein
MFDCLKNKRIIAICFMLALVLTFASGNAFCAFDADWGISRDTGMPGYLEIADWLVDNEYYDNFYDAWEFAEIGYIGHDQGQPDPFFWELGDREFEIEIVAENAGFADRNTLGFYTGAGSSKDLTQIFGGTDNGPETLMLSEPFGLYMSTPQRNFWFTDRSENDQQRGRLKRFGGNPQALIYELQEDVEWLIAWEDLDASRICSDRDYNDMYVKLTVVPEPIGLVLFLLGGGALLGSRIKRKV